MRFIRVSMKVVGDGTAPSATQLWAEELIQYTYLLDSLPLNVKIIIELFKAP